MAAAWQRCLVHFLRNLRGKTPARHQPEIRARVGSALKASSKADAEKGILQTAEWISRSNSKLADWLEDAAPEVTAHMEFALGLWPRIRSNNLLERFNKELRCRERVVGIFLNQASALRLITAMAVEKDEEWREGKRYLNPELLAQGKLRKAS